MRQFDYVILGAGAAGMMLAYRMSKDDYFKDKRIAIIEANKEIAYDKTWCYWEEPKGEWDYLIDLTWDKAYFGSPKFSAVLDLAPLQYKMIKCGKFFESMREEIGRSDNIELIFSKFEKMQLEGESYIIDTAGGQYIARRILSSVFKPDILKNQKKYPYLKQHFIGWAVKVECPVFNPDVVTFMDFNIAQKGNTRFMYILPTSTTEAMLEYTLFSEDLLDEEEYEAGIREYLTGLNVGRYEIIEKEGGDIPMSTYPFHRHNARNFMYIGTAGGWTKASTGYTFQNTTKQTKVLVEFLKTEQGLDKFHHNNRFNWYDKVFLSVLKRNNHLGAEVFADIFRKVEAGKVFRFLSEESNFGEEFEIMNSVPKGLFIKEGMREAFGVLSLR